MTPQEMQKKLTEAMGKLSPEQQLEILKTINESVAGMNEAFTEYFDKSVSTAGAKDTLK